METDNLPPSEGPFDEEEPMLPVDPPNPHGKFYTIGMVFLISFIGLLIATVAFAALYFHLQAGSNKHIPLWPAPSNSPLGKYTKGSVAADNELCSEVGRNILLQGGNAVDAAISSLFCIGIMDSHSAGIGGGHFMTIYNASTKTCHVVDAREVAPAAATEDMFKGHYDDSQIGWLAIAVPGELHGMWTEYINFGGRIPWANLVQPTIELLQEGYPTSHALAEALQSKRNVIIQEKTMNFFIDPTTGDVYKAGDQIKTRANFLATLLKIANSSDPIKLFYEGEIAQASVKEFQQYGAILTLDDFANYKSIIRKPEEIIQVRLKNGRHICGPPPPAGAAVAQAILSIMDGYEYNLTTIDSYTELYHHFIEASKFAYAGRSQLGDIPNATEIARNITTPEWASWVRFGAIRASESTGIIWNDEMDDFSSPGKANHFGLLRVMKGSLDLEKMKGSLLRLMSGVRLSYPPSPANFIRPGKRPQSSMSPLIIFDENDSQRLLTVGGAGGSTIISGVSGVALHAMWVQNNIKQAIDFPRLHNQLQPNVTQYETNFPEEYIAALAARGHDMQPRDNLTVVTAVERLADRQIYANSDYRKGDESGCAGY